VEEIYDLIEEVLPGAWVAGSEREHRVLAYCVDSKSVLDKARAQGDKLPLILREPALNLELFLQSKERNRYFAYSGVHFPVSEVCPKGRVG
jgi:hypothetical protein